MSSTLPSSSTDRSASRRLAAIVLAAGKGKRMQSDLPKVAHEVAGQSIVRWVVDTVRAVHADPIVLVVGHGAEVIHDIFAGDDTDLRFAMQDEQLGTGHATLCAEESLAGFDGDVLVLAGDGPLIRPETIQQMYTRQRETNAAGTLATSVVDDSTGYGRVIRDESGRFLEIVEQKNATPEQLEVHEIYPSYACYDGRLLFEALQRVQRNELTGEYYVTDVPALLRASGHRIELVDAVPPEDVLSINTPEQLAEVEAVLLARRAATVEVPES